MVYKSHKDIMLVLICSQPLPTQFYQIHTSLSVKHAKCMEIIPIN